MFDTASLKSSSFEWCHPKFSSSFVHVCSGGYCDSFWCEFCAIQISSSSELNTQPTKPCNRNDQVAILEQTALQNFFTLTVVKYKFSRKRVSAPIMRLNHRVLNT
ncbi:hypothetical protein AVEN_120673-1 [Araneus ventricosus]|uniref:Uncharacterized protein n=1 Tax=Araneus ventricosus TaxID=182803 RepID=A0A4Y2P3G8_ARAVE|nr:hypothetical protein AVEN_120673-1 [Araneus ventricosus]